MNLVTTFARLLWVKFSFEADILYIIFIYIYILMSKTDILYKTVYVNIESSLTLSCGQINGTWKSYRTNNMFVWTGLCGQGTCLKDLLVISNNIQNYIPQCHLIHDFCDTIFISVAYVCYGSINLCLSSIKYDSNEYDND